LQVPILSDLLNAFLFADTETLFDGQRGKRHSPGKAQGPLPLFKKSEKLAPSNRPQGDNLGQGKQEIVSEQLSTDG